jgi:exonuclease III
MATEAVRITSMNMRGGKSSKRKRRAMRPLVCGNSVLPAADVVLLQETVLSGDDATGPMEPEMAQMYADDIAPECRSFWTGHCGIILSPAMDAYRAEAQSVLDGRLLLVELTRDTTKLHVACVYAPAAPKPRVLFLPRMQRVLEGHTDHARLIVGGDWNIVLRQHQPHAIINTLSSTHYYTTITTPLLHHYYTTTTTPLHRRRCHPDTRARTRTRANPNPSRGEEASQSYQQ